jgi:hypothetical protein
LTISLKESSFSLFNDMPAMPKNRSTEDKLSVAPFDINLELHERNLDPENKLNPEKYCHNCGKAAKTSFNRPFCMDCFKELNK